MTDLFHGRARKSADGVKIVEPKEDAGELFKEFDKPDEGNKPRLRPFDTAQGFGGSPLRSEKNIPWKLILIVVVGLAVIAGLFFGVRALVGVINAREDDNENQNITGNDRSGWQAVFLTNGQTYFGRVKDVGEIFLVLEDVYYLRKVDIGLSSNSLESGSNISNEGTEVGSETKLVKFGTEKHRPVDELKINMMQVLFLEELAIGSEIVVAIERYKSDN